MLQSNLIELSSARQKHDVCTGPKWPFKNADTVLTANNVKYENLIIGAIKHSTSDLNTGRETKVGKQGVLSLYLFEITK